MSKFFHIFKFLLSRQFNSVEVLIIFIMERVVYINPAQQILIFGKHFTVDYWNLELEIWVQNWCHVMSS